MYERDKGEARSCHRARRGPQASSVSQCPEEKQSIEWAAEAGECAFAAYRVGDHIGELFEAQSAIAVLVRLHDRLVHNFLELCILRGI